ncbi:MULTISPECIES: TAXI family TRAP transporter solute-binding subunit [unclassified Nocardiopsis]|uniref:TAXI family TRAP transporter solute-binding subunit n=1 Tax=Nocardiopsis TaxID=2013 RepID=UPI00387A8709
MDAPPSRRSPARLLLITGGAALSLALAGGLLYVFRPGADPEPVAAPEPPAYAGDYHLGARPLGPAAPDDIAAKLAPLWSEDIDGVTFDFGTTAVMDADFRALEGRIDNPLTGKPYRNDVLLSSADVYHEALLGTGDFADEPLADPDGLRTLGNITPWVTQFVVPADSDIETLADLAGRRMAADEHLGPPEEAMLILAVAGVDPLNDLEYVSDPFVTYEPLMSGEADFYATVDRVHSGEINHMADQGLELRVLDVPREVIAKLALLEPGTTALTIAAGEHPALEDADEITLAASWTSLYTTDRLDADLAYLLVEAAFERLPEKMPSEWIRAQDALAGIEPDTLHPGARRYYEEQGLL